ncbi:hypothetical protein CR158_17820 [Halomonas heilongjiangensis]|uniref:Nucleotidyltransferase family protein n=3 Tax=Halomonas heilongjiangensis TaxID=1387883 RepID=A0A2N7TUK4_9GAMM|nr:hypothetical protein C1H66_01130 [Halomonas heilongjiangensis]PXX87661.1 hypothetical protein CR158_17820 [Halomonas heilongjiangensis]
MSKTAFRDRVFDQGRLAMSPPRLHPPLDPVLQLLLLLARLELDDAQSQAARALCQRITDWARVTHEARQRFILPVVYRHLRLLEAEGLSQDQWRDMKRDCLAVIQHNLFMSAAQRQLRDELLVPLGIPHLFFKGPSLAARYYDDPGLRFCRDIDVLVSPEQLVGLLQAAVDRGYTPYMPKGLGRDPGGLAFAANVHRVVSLLSPQGAPIEIHQQIDGSRMLYATGALLDDAEQHTLDGTPMAVMPTAELFVYACLHHTRHHWSHLHWLMDIDAIQRHASFDPEAVKACAMRRRLGTTLEASLELYRVLSTPGPWDEATISRNGRDLLGACLTALQGGWEEEMALRKTRMSKDFAFAWQASRRHRLHGRMQGILKFLLPTYADYHRWPLPRRWQWVYRLSRPIRKTYSRITTGRRRP